MTSFQVTQWLRQGIAAAKAGDVELASELLLKVVDVDEYNEQAWLWLSSVVEGDADREVCLENVLAINPDNKLAKAGLVHLHSKAMQPALPKEPKPEPSPEPESSSFSLGESVDALQSDWWDQPQAPEPVFEPSSPWEDSLQTATSSAVEPAEAGGEWERAKAKRRRRRTVSTIQRLVVPVFLLLGLLASAVAVAAKQQVGPFDPTKHEYADAMRPLFAEYHTWWVGPQGELLSELNAQCGATADGWRNRDVLDVCHASPTVDCSLLVAHCGADVEAMRERVDELARDVQLTGGVLVAAFAAISPPGDIAQSHARFVACLRARINDADRVGQLARGAPFTSSDDLPLCQMFSSAEEEILAYVGNH